MRMPTTIMANADLYRLMAWLSPAYPVGGYSYSHGLELAVEEGLVTGCAELIDWLEAIFRDGSGATTPFCSRRPIALPLRTT